MMSTTSGFVLGVLASATLTVLYGEQLSASLQEAVELHPRVAAQIEEVATRNNLEQLQQLAPKAQGIVNRVKSMANEVSTQPSSPGVSAPQESHIKPGVTDAPTLEDSTQVAAEEDLEPEPIIDADVEPGQALQINLEQRWADYARRANELTPNGEFPWRACFRRAAASYELPEALLLAIASGESNFDPAARSDKDAVGLMQVRWPDTSRHLGIVREADLYDPCTNVDAGARYLVQLAEQYSNNYHLVVAAYNYGPSRISADKIPAGAAWYSQYIYQHLQQVLGEEHIPASELIERPQPADSGHQVLMTFNQSYRARDYITFVRAQLPGLNLQQQSEVMGHHDVVLIYENETERRQALRLIDDAGIATLNPQHQTKLYL